MLQSLGFRGFRGCCLNQSAQKSVEPVLSECKAKEHGNYYIVLD